MGLIGNEDLMPSYEFGPFLLDVEARILQRDGKPVVMTGKTLDTLVALVENHGRLVRKDELLSLVWPGVVVEESNLSQSIFTVRKVLGDSRKERRYIATITGRGYQFVAPVKIVTSAQPSVDVAISAVAEEADSGFASKLVKRYKRVAISVTAVALAAIVVIWFLWHTVSAGSRPYVARHW